MTAPQQRKGGKEKMSTSKRHVLHPVGEPGSLKVAAARHALLEGPEKGR